MDHNPDIKSGKKVIRQGLLDVYMGTIDVIIMGTTARSPHWHTSKLPGKWLRGRFFSASGLLISLIKVCNAISVLDGTGIYML